MSIIKHQDRTLGGGGGHKVLNSQGTAMTDRPNLQFLGMQVTDDNANGKTVVQGPSVPTALSAFTNDTNFINNTVSNLTNYYTKTESYTKTEVDTLISAAKMGRFIVVSVLPTENIDTTAIYLLPKSLTSSSNIKDEYINLNGTSTGWEKIGDTEIDLSNYVTTAAMNTALAGKLDNVEGAEGQVISFDSNGDPIASDVTPSITYYYVDAVNGNDNNDGLTEETPFATINKALSTPTAINRISIKIADGVYNERISLSNNKYYYFYCQDINNCDVTIQDENGESIVLDSYVKVTFNLPLKLKAGGASSATSCIKINGNASVIFQRNITLERFDDSSETKTGVGIYIQYAGQVHFGGNVYFNAHFEKYIRCYYGGLVSIRGNCVYMYSDGMFECVASIIQIPSMPATSTITTSNGGRIFVGAQEEYATTAAMNNMIQVTSTDPGEGASFTGKLLVVVEE